MVIDTNGDFCYNEAFKEYGSEKIITVNFIMFSDEYTDYGFSFITPKNVILTCEDYMNDNC